MKKKIIFSSCIILLVVLLVYIFSLFLGNSTDNIAEEVVYTDADFTLNELKNIFNEKSEDCVANIKNGNLLMVCENIEYEFILNEYEISVESSDDKILDIFKDLVLSYQSFYYDDVSVLNDTIGLFLEQKIYLSGLDMIFIDNIYYLTLDLNEILEIYDPENTYYNDDKIYLGDTTFIYQNEYITINNGELLSSKLISTLNLAGYITLISDVNYIVVEIYDYDNIIIETFEFDITDDLINFVFNMEVYNLAEVNYVILNTK